MNLYFLDTDDNEILVEEDISKEQAVSLALNDLKKRVPKAKSYYQRCWEDDHGRFWIDYGSHTCFYIMHG